MLALGTPTSQLDSAWETAEHHEVTADELAAAKVIRRFGQPRKRRHATEVELSFGSDTLQEIDQTRATIEQTRSELTALETHRLGLMVKAVEEEHEPVTAVAIAAGIIRERYYQLRRAAESE